MAPLPPTAQALALDTARGFGTLGWALAVFWLPGGWLVTVAGRLTPRHTARSAGSHTTYMTQLLGSLHCLHATVYPQHCHLPSAAYCAATRVENVRPPPRLAPLNKAPALPAPPSWPTYTSRRPRSLVVVGFIHFMWGHSRVRVSHSPCCFSSARPKRAHLTLVYMYVYIYIYVHIHVYIYIYIYM